MRYEVWIDRGGTFTDCVLFDRHTQTRTITKVLSSDDAPLVALRQLLALAPTTAIPPCDIYMGTTLATNALLERKGSPTALVITRGFGDVLAIGDQTRPDLFALSIPPRPQLQAWTFEIDARLDAQGNVLAEPSQEDLADLSQQLLAAGASSVALVCMHATAHPGFEQRLAQRLLQHFVGQRPRIYCSSDSLAEQGLLARAGACVMDAYVSPTLDAYLGHLQEQLPGSRLQLMQSAGGLSPPEHFRGPQAILSGPAGGIVAAEKIAQTLGLTQLVSVDMGGTSTDVSLFLGSCELRRDTVIGGIKLRSPVLDIHTIASGGGSICGFDGYRLVVGPESVGAVPGPLCYPQDQAAPAALDVAITDVNLVLGRLGADFFPFPLRAEASRQGLERVADNIFDRTGQRPTVPRLALDFAAVVAVQMAEAIRSIALSRGVDVHTLDLLLLGGASGQHACDVARYLGIRRIFVHRLCGVLSAYGIGHADTLWQQEQDGGRLVLDADHYPQLCEQFAAMEARGEHSQRPPWDGAQLHVERWVELRYTGTESTIAVHLLSWEQTLRQFHAEHAARFGYARHEHQVEVVLVRSQLRWRRPPQHELKTEPDASARPASWVRLQPVHLSDGTLRDVPLYHTHLLRSGQCIEGPALLLDAAGTLLVDAGFRAQLQGEMIQLVDHTPQANQSYDAAARAAILGHRFTAIATQMGEALRRSASSTNMRDRLDYSCALFDPEANLIANAPHIPVHLGAMSATVRAMKRLHPKMQPGDSYVSNDPALGGSHLPDITVVTPIFDTEQRLLGFTASRGHHADVGGISPGSMPAHSRTLADEGVVFSGQLLVRAGQFLDQSVLSILTFGAHPARNPGENLADLKAQLSANLLGARLLQELGSELSRDGLLRGMGELCALAQRWVEDSIAKLPRGTRRLCDTMDDGTVICASIHVGDRRLDIDFSGTSAEQPSNINAPYAVTLASVLYVLRTLIGRPLPLNDGCLAPIALHLPERSVVSPSAHAAVAAGNVETSQRIVDVLLGALGLCAASQGTMNNLSFENDTFGYYETIAGGVGASRSGHGASATHSHMTNTKITDPELMEARFPVRLREFSVRRGSGGTGAFNGGDGIVRVIEALEPLRYSLLADRRASVPFGLHGGGAGAAGRNFLDRVPLPGRVAGNLEPGSELRIETPGGGGYGVPGDGTA